MTFQCIAELAKDSKISCVETCKISNEPEQKKPSLFETAFLYFNINEDQMPKAAFTLST